MKGIPVHGGARLRLLRQLAAWQPADEWLIKFRLSLIDYIGQNQSVGLSRKQWERLRSNMPMPCIECEREGARGAGIYNVGLDAYCHKHRRLAEQRLSATYQAMKADANQYFAARQSSRDARDVSRERLRRVRA